jgi:hypothetical protein
MTTFTKLSYDDVSEIMNKACPGWSGGDIVTIDESKITEGEFIVLKKYLEQEGYQQS